MGKAIWDTMGCWLDCDKQSAKGFSVREENIQPQCVKQAREEGEDMWAEFQGVSGWSGCGTTDQH